jgi:hypothetical protein
MALLKTVTPEEADGFIAEAYANFQKAIGSIPKPIQMMSASPSMFEDHIKTITYFNNHPTLTFPLLTMIRFLVAPDCEWDFCIDFNRNLLKKMGMEDDEIESTRSNPENAPLEENEQALLLVVLKAVRSPETVKKDDIDRLRELGWNDSDIYDATYHGARMLAMSTMFNAFKMYDL